MNRILSVVLIAGAFLLLNLEATAQSVPYIGVRGGASITDIASQVSTESRTGISLAVFGAFGGDAIVVDIVTELGYGEKGFRQPDPELASLRASYVEGYLLASLPLNLSSRFRLNALAGLAPAFLLTQSGATSDGQATAQPDVFSSFDLGAAAGGSLSADLLSTAVILDIRYVYGLSDNITTTGLPFSNRTLSFSIGVAYSL